MLSHLPSQGAIGIGTLPRFFMPLLESIQFHYSTSYLPTLNVSTHHIHVANVSPFLKEQVDNLISQPLWSELCSSLSLSHSQCMIQPIMEMNELYYSNPSHAKKRRHLYGTAANFEPHTDSAIPFPSVYLYRVLIGLSDGNNHSETYFPAWKKGAFLNRGDYLIFDFDRTLHQVRKNPLIRASPRYLVKLHFLVYDSSIYPMWIKQSIYQYYVWYDWITRWMLVMGTDPITYPEYVMGWFIQLFITPYFVRCMMGSILFTYVMIRYLEPTPSRIKACVYSWIGPLLALLSLSLGDWATDHILHKTI